MRIRTVRLRNLTLQTSRNFHQRSWVDTSQHSKETQDQHPLPHATCEQDQPAGLQEDSTEAEMNTQTDSQLSYMEAEDSSTTQEEKIEEEKPPALEVDKNNQENKVDEPATSHVLGKGMSYAAVKSTIRD
uniref:Uncharacterized protein n=1 Tax=Sphaerodactylus townsendi TaxID=933632 RepID=A0ACB8GFS2_9SAUR